MTFDPIEERDATIAAMRADKVEFARWRDKWVADMQALETRLARSEDATEAAEAEVEGLREGIRALADHCADMGANHGGRDDPSDREFRSAHRVIEADLCALLASPPAATTGEAGECLGVRVTGQMSAMICDEDGWVRSGTFHWGTDYKCTGSVHPPLDSPIWPGHEIRCANPIHNVTEAAGMWIPATFVPQPDPTACPTCGANRGEHGLVNGELCPRLSIPAPVSSGEAGTGEAVHWVGDAPTSLHGNGAASFARTTRDAFEVTCRLCLTLLAREDDGAS